jgi:hypothetical protein
VPGFTRPTSPHVCLAWLTSRRTRSTSSNPYSPTMADSIVEGVIDQFRTRAEQGKAKYGTTMDRNDLTPMQWIQHLQEELMDAVVYLQKIKTLELKENNKGVKV